MDEKKELPGVVFHFSGSEEQYTADATRQYKVTLLANVRDEEMFKDIQHKLLEGITIYRSEDFRGKMIQTLQEDVGEYGREIARLEHALAAKTKEAEDARAELTRMNSSLDFLRRV